MKKFMSVEEAKKISKLNEESKAYRESYQHHVDRAEQLSRESFGAELAQKVAKKLLSGLAMKYDHRDYCGHGLSYDGSKFILATYIDGTIDRQIMAWNNQDQFVAFLQGQSDFSMSGASTLIQALATTENFYIANQTITKARLVEFVA